MALVMKRSLAAVAGLAALAAPMTTASAASGEAAAARVKMLVVSGALADRGDALAGALFGGEPTLLDYVEAVESIGESGSADALIVRLKDASMDASDVEEFGAAIDAVRAAGVKVHLYTESLGTVEALLGARCDEVIVQAGGPVMLPGLHMEEIFLADTFEWLGLQADMIQVGKYKGANEMLTRSGPSEAWDENISGLLDAQWDEITTAIANGRGLSDRELTAALSRLWFATAEDAVEAGVADAAVDLEALFDHLETTHGEVTYTGEVSVGPDEMELDFANPFALFNAILEPPRRDADGPTLAVLHLDGPIVDGDSSAETLFGGGNVGSRTLRNAMQDIADDDDIEGVVVRIDSPGGSATASEMIWLGLRRLAETKPVWVSVGSMAASGGYYTAVGGDRIYVNPSSIVGSIGVVGGKITMGDFLSRGRVRVTERSRGPRGGMMSTQSGWNEAERALVRLQMASTYAKFASRVREGREGIDLDRVGEGRLFLGRDAVDLGMADEIGSLADALDDLAGSVGLDRYEVMHFPAPPTIDELIRDSMGGMIRLSRGMAPSPAGRDPGRDQARGLIRGLAAEALGEARLRDIAAQLEALTQLRESPVLLTSPTAVRLSLD